MKIEKFEVQYSVLIKHTGKIINFILDAEELENNGICSTLINRGYFTSINCNVYDLIEIIERELII